jgi:hypothetical protein
MKLLLAIAAIALVAGLLYADYKWRRWIAARRSQRDDPQHRDRDGR